MTGNHVRCGVLGLVGLSVCGLRGYAQTAPPAVDPAVANLAHQIGEQLQKARVKGVFVADLRGPDGQQHPVGKWLADQVSSSLEKDFPELQVIDRSQMNNFAIEEDRSEDDPNSLEFKKEKELARKLGASVVVAGSFARIPQGIGISLFARFCSDSKRQFEEMNGLISISDEIAALSPAPIPSPKTGVLRAGTGGTSIPKCIHCPVPRYSKEARAAKYQGEVVLSVTVTPDGRAADVKIVRTPGMGLAENAVEAVRKWRFKPAVGPDGKPVPVVVPIQIRFHLF